MTEKSPQELVDKFGSIREAARQTGIPYSTLRDRISAARDRVRYIPNPDEDLPPPEVHKPAVIDINKSKIRIFAVGDTHDSPSIPDKSRFKWFARHVAETRPDIMVQIGDMADWDSVSSHAEPGSIEYALRPTINQDIESLDEALDSFDKIIKPGQVRKIITKGNHEDRLDRFENNNPETEGAVVAKHDDLLSQHGWGVYKYGQWVFVNNVAFVHCPMTQMGRPYGGKMPENQIGNDAICSVVFGHTHKGGYRSFPKLGPQQSIEVLNLGCAMPMYTMKKYASRSTTGWTYGVYDITIHDNHITSFSFTRMDDLEERYKD